MGIYLNPGNEGFRTAISSKIYVDKTGLLEYTNSVLDSEQGRICISRPRRFGKSIAAEMLVAYYGKGYSSDELFQGLKIEKASDYRNHLNQYNVIHVDMNTLRHRRIAGTRDKISAMETVDRFHMEVIRELREEFGECVKEQVTDLPTALMNVYEATGDKFVIIIDEWDTLFREDKQDERAQEAYIDMFRGLFKDAPSKKFLKLAYITGILPIKKYGTQSALNNFDEFTMTNPSVLAEYVGFTEDEVKALCTEYDMDFAETKRWYDGYSFRKVQHLYSPNSVVKAMCRRDFDNYWTRTETYESLKNYICMNYDGLKDTIVRMLAGASDKVNSNKFQNDMVSFESKDDILTLLVHLGYLAYNQDTQQVYIPNEEVRSEFKNAIEETGWDSVIRAIETSDALLKATWNEDSDAVAAGIQKVHMENTSILQYNDENALSCVVSLAYYNAINDYTLVREMPDGKGFADIVFLPRKHSDKPAMIMELKYDGSVDSALNQIKTKQYASALNGYKGTVLLVGINYDAKSKGHQCKIEKMILD